MRAEPELIRHHLHQLLLDRQHVLARRETGAVRDAKDMRVDRDRRLAKRGVEDDVCGLAPDSGKALERLARARDVSVMLLYQQLACCQEVFRLRAVKTDAADVALDALASERGHCGWRGRRRKQGRRREIDAFVRGLSRQHDRDQQLKWRRIGEFAARIRIRCSQAFEHAVNGGGLHMSTLGRSVEFYRVSGGLKNVVKAACGIDGTDGQVVSAQADQRGMAARQGAPYNGRTQKKGGIAMSHFPALCAAALLSACLSMNPAAAAEQVTVERESKLYAEPRLDAPTESVLEAGTTAEVVGKSGAWLNVKTPSATGWVFSFNVRFSVGSPDAAPSTSGGGDSAIGRIFGPERGVNVTSTIGIRGLDTEDLRQAQFNAEQMKLLDGYAVQKDAAAQNASGKGLAPVQVEYLEAGSR